MGVIVSCGVTVSTVDDLFGEADDDSEAGEDRDAYNDVAGWLIFVGIAGIISQVILLIFRLLYYFEAFSANFTVFAVIVSNHFNLFCDPTLKPSLHDMDKFHPLTLLNLSYITFCAT